MVPAVGARGQTAHPNPLWIWKLISSMKKEERERKKKSLFTVSFSAIMSKCKNQPKGGNTTDVLMAYQYLGFVRSFFSG